MFALSYKVGSLVAVAAFVGVAFLFAGIAQLVVASRVPTTRWLSVVGGILGVAAGVDHFRLARHHPVRRVDPGGLVVDRLGLIHIVSALAGPRSRGGGPGCCSASPIWCRGVGSPLLGALAGDAGKPWSECGPSTE